YRQLQMVDLQMLTDAQRPRQITGIRAGPQLVVPRELFKLTVLQTIDARVAHMEQVGRGRLDDQRAEGADVAALTVVTVLALAGLGVQPGAGGGQHALGRLAHRPGLRRAVVSLQEPADRDLAGNMADAAGADAIGQGQGNALHRQLRLARHPRPVKVLIERLAPPVRSLTEGDLQRLPCSGPDPATGVCTHAGCRIGVRRGAVRTWVVYRVSPVKARPPTRLPRAVGISFQIM